MPRAAGKEKAGFPSLSLRAQFEAVPAPAVAADDPGRPGVVTELHAQVAYAHLDCRGLHQGAPHTLEANISGEMILPGLRAKCIRSFHFLALSPVSLSSTNRAHVDGDVPAP